MLNENQTENTPPPSQLRKRIMEALYDFFKNFPYAQMELSHICEECRSEPRELNWNMVYLEKCGFLELSKSEESPPYVACSASISAAGIDLVEDTGKFNQRFNVSED